MTHRSRSFANTKQNRASDKKGKTRKLHHPPPRVDPAVAAAAEAAAAAAAPDLAPESDDDEVTVLPASVFLETPDSLDVLNVLRSALHAAVHSVDFNADVQKVKALLYERKWIELFTDPQLLDAYAGRWVPSRALCFRELMAGIREVRALFQPAGEEDEEDEDEDADADAEKDKDADAEKEADATPVTKHILAIGGGAGSELLAVGAMSAAGPGSHVTWTGVDIGNWSSILDRMESAVRDRWAVNASFNFIETDVLAGAPGTAPAFLDPLPDLDLTTIFFTLTELLSQNRARTVSLLKAITARTPPGGLLLVADSASDITEFPLGKDGRTWPVYMVLDALVLQALGAGQWEKVRSSNSKWFRLDEDTVNGARWPCKLENARYWMRMYRRL